jgi:hypothetical protein
MRVDRAPFPDDESAIFQAQSQSMHAGGAFDFVIVENHDLWSEQ